MNFTKIDTVGLDRVLERGSGDLLARSEHALLVRDHISGALMLACDDAEVGLSLLDRYAGEDCDLLMVCGDALWQTAFDRYGYTDKLECDQFAYLGEPPELDPRLTVRPATERDLPLLLQHYHLLIEDDLQKVVRRGSVILGYEGDRLIGFAGEHLEGSMGLLYVLPEYRRRGFGTALETHLIARTLAQGLIPFGHVVKGNDASVRLQEKLGMTRSDKLFVWMWR